MAQLRERAEASRRALDEYRVINDREAARPDSNRDTAAGDLAARLRACRTASGLSQLALADAIGISKNRLSHIEQGDTSPSAEEIEAWCWSTGTFDQAGELISMAGQRRLRG